MSNPCRQIDVPTVPPRGAPTHLRHGRCLDVGDAFIIVNDHDPIPLNNQLQAEYPGQVSWSYLEQGPAVWRVELGRQKAA